MPVNDFTHERRARFWLVGDAIHTCIEDVFSSSHEVIIGPCEPDMLVGDIQRHGGEFEAWHWETVESERHYWTDKKRFGISAPTLEMLIERMNQQLGSKQDFLEALVH
jgi:hypothetical protein